MHEVGKHSKFKGKGSTKKANLTRLSATPHPPLIGPWEIFILGPYSNVAVDAIGHEMDFTLEIFRIKYKKHE